MPETFVVSWDGQIADKHIGAIAQKAFEETLVPSTRHLRKMIQMTLPVAPATERERS